MKPVHGACWAVALCAAAMSGQGGVAQEKQAPRIVSQILKVEYLEQANAPQALVVNVVGQVPTGGYTNVRLVRAIYITAPEDGIQDYFLLAEPPAGVAAQVISEVKASDTWKAQAKEAPWLKGIRVHGVGAGGVVKMIAGK